MNALPQGAVSFQNEMKSKKAADPGLTQNKHISTILEGLARTTPIFWNPLHAREAGPDMWELFVLGFFTGRVHIIAQVERVCESDKSTAFVVRMDKNRPHLQAMLTSNLRGRVTFVRLKYLDEK